MDDKSPHKETKLVAKLDGGPAGMDITKDGKTYLL